ncbi:NAD(P)/FAD-dependent oxidoreductase [Govanella unica]|uniref:FAD-binding oxidoreductase n=1 Tax=Govanella unica TaxID=2975056 RepID=A0A9X3TW79_9PROT|nr:FAD-binding oxidoreductase [Govania unica]MDA5192866.1 FAD-binding oxidoreductase [Govania unica]
MSKRPVAERIDADVIIIGAGIAGASAAAGLGAGCRVVLLEQEEVAGYHTTGRSAAFFAETYGNEAVRRLTTASKAFFLTPPAGFSDQPLMRERGGLYIARADQLASLEALYRDKHAVLPSVTRVDADYIRAHVPLIRPDYATAGVWDPDCRDIDVHALHQGFLRQSRLAGGRLLTAARVVALTYQQGHWQTETAAGHLIHAPIVINAAGAWADGIARLAGARPLGLSPRRRTVAILPAPAALAGNSWPLVLDADDQFYFKPESGRILTSPGDATPMLPQDVQPDIEDVAMAVARVEAVLQCSFDRVERKWAGLRTFAPDDAPVVGADPERPGFFWFAGQGGYGMQTAPAMSALIAGLVTTGRVPDALAEYGITAALYSPARFAR